MNDRQQPSQANHYRYNRKDDDSNAQESFEETDSYNESRDTPWKRDVKKSHNKDDSDSFQVFVHSAKGSQAIWVKWRMKVSDVIDKIFPELPYGRKKSQFHVTIGKENPQLHTILCKTALKPNGTIRIKAKGKGGSNKQPDAQET